MAEHSVSDDDLFELPLYSPFGSVERGGHSDLGAPNFLKIDSKWLIDPRHLSIGSMISEGPYSVVYEGSYKSKPVAVKVIQPDKTSAVSPERKEKFVREVAMLSRVKHDNIVKFIGAYVEPTMMIITELMRGGTLQKYLWSIRPNSPDLKLSISFALGISRAMEYLHANSIIHRDLKPSNLLLMEDKKKIKVADFGLAREETMGEMTAEVGTYRWMAPELFSVEPIKLGVKKHYNHKVDIYSFSMVLWELLTNSTPFKGRNNVMVAYASSMNLRPSMDNIPKDIAPLLESCWAEDPEERPEFVQITDFLLNFLRSMPSIQLKSPKQFEIGQAKGKIIADSRNTDHMMNKSREEDKKSRSQSRCFLSCFDYCFSDGLRNTSEV
ncbi:serine/threonine-protein kinase STY13-like [Camellia sinensis]|uniref:serine/threonine-protein kinase STY13-like n=1 Tax=Camellia sinensis TaxID=4442 RepID=UPI0010367DFE|nr:serine/threonine-protein kinase STY13-like [Camellia sinensis]